MAELSAVQTDDLIAPEPEILSAPVAIPSSEENQSPISSTPIEGMELEDEEKERLKAQDVFDAKQDAKLEAMDSSTMAQTKNVEDSHKEISDVEADITAKLAGQFYDTDQEVSAHDLKQFKNVNFLDKMATLTKRNLVYAKVDEFENDIINIIKMRDPQGWEKLAKSDALAITYLGLKSTVNDVLKNPRVENTAQLRKYLSAIYLGLGATEVQLNAFVQDIENVVNIRLTGSNFVESALSGINFQDGITQEEFDRFDKFATTYISTRFAKTQNEHMAKVWKTAMAPFAWVPTEGQSQGDADHLIDKGMYELTLGTFVGNTSPLNIGGKSGLIPKGAPMLSILSTLASYFYVPTEDETKLYRDFDKMWGSGKWQGMVLARGFRDIGMGIVSGGVVNVGSKVLAASPLLRQATHINPSTLNARVLQQWANWTTGGSVFALFETGLTAATIASQGQEFTDEVIERLQTQLMHMVLLGGGFGMLGGGFTLAAGTGVPQAGAKYTSKTAKAVTQKLLDWSRGKAPEWFAAQVNALGENVMYGAQHRLSYLFPEGAARLQKHVESLKPRVFTKELQDETLKQIRYAAEKTGHPPSELGMSPISLLDDPELIINRLAHGEIMHATINVAKRKEYSAGDFSHIYEEIAETSERLFPPTERGLVGQAAQSFQRAMGKYNNSSMTNLSHFAKEMMGKERLTSTIAVDVLKDYRESVLRRLVRAKDRTALSVALNTGNNLGIELTPVQLVGELLVNPADVPIYYSTRGAWNEAHKVHSQRLSKRFSQDGFVAVKGEINTDFGSELIMKPYTTKDIFGHIAEKEVPTIHTIESVQDTIPGRAFKKYLEKLSDSDKQKAIDKMSKGQVFGQLHDLNTGQDVLRGGVPGIITEGANIVPISNPLAKLPGFIPGQQTGEHLVVKVNRDILKKVIKEGGTEEGRVSGAVTVEARSENYSIAKAHTNKLSRERAPDDKHIEYMTTQTSSPGHNQITANQDFFTSLGEDTAESGMLLIKEISKGLKLNKAEAEQFAELLSRASMNSSLRQRGTPVKAIGKGGALEFNQRKDGSFDIKWNGEIAPYLNTIKSADKYLASLAREIGSRDFIEATRKYFLKTYSEFLTHKNDVYSKIDDLALKQGFPTAKKAIAAKRRMEDFQSLIAMHQYRGRTPAMVNLGNKIVEGAKIANNTLAEVHSPLHHLTKGMSDWIINRPDLPTQFVHWARTLTSLRLFAFNLRVGVIQTLPIIENSQYSIVGPKHLLDPALVAGDALAYFANTVTGNSITTSTKLMSLKIVRRGQDLKNFIDETAILRDLQHATPGGADSVVGNSFSPIMKTTSAAAEAVLYGQFKVFEGMNRLIAGSATYRRMEIFRDAALRKIKVGGPMNKLTTADKRNLANWKQLDNGDWVMTKVGKERGGNEARLIAGDMAERKNFPASNRGLFGVGLQYNGILMPRLAERYIPFYGNTFSPGRQAWNALQISIWMGVGGVAFGLEAIELYQNTMRNLFKDARPTGRMFIERNIEEASRTLADTVSVPFKGPMNINEWNKVIRDGAFGQFLFTYPGTIQKFLPSRMVTELIHNYVKEGSIPVNLLMSPPVVSQAVKQAQGLDRSWEVLKSFIKGLPDKSMYELLSNPEQRNDAMVDLGPAFRRMTTAASYGSGISSWFTALQVYSGEYNGETVVDNQGRLRSVPAPGLGADKKLENFLLVWGGAFPDARDLMREASTVSSDARRRWAYGVGREFITRLRDTQDRESADQIIAEAEEQIKDSPDAYMLRAALFQAVTQSLQESGMPSIADTTLDLYKKLNAKDISISDAEIVQRQLQPVD